MAQFGLDSRFLALLAAVLMVIPAPAFAGDEDEVGWPYRGPNELRTTGSGEEEERKRVTRKLSDILFYTSRL